MLCNLHIKYFTTSWLKLFFFASSSSPRKADGDYQAQSWKKKVALAAKAL